MTRISCLNEMLTHFKKKLKIDTMHQSHEI